MWKTLPKPFFVMAPMADVTDAAFRALIAARAAPDVFWTEFVSADGLYHTREIAKMPDVENPLMRDLVLDFRDIGCPPRKLDIRCPNMGSPTVAQIFSNKPEMITYATRVVAELGFDGIDLNMGCPDRAIEKQGSGAAMIKSPEVARAVIRAAKAASSLPVSVKTRIGYTKESLDEWLPVLLEEAPAAITLHLRTRKDLSLVPAKWELMKKAVEIRDRINPDVLLIGNGDVASVEKGARLASKTGCDGVMIGRGMFGNPWVFEGIGGFRKSPILAERDGLRKSGFREGFTKSQHGLSEKLTALIELAYNFEKLMPPKNFSILKKHIKAFVTGFDGAALLRARLMETSSAAELSTLIANYRIEE